MSKYYVTLYAKICNLKNVTNSPFRQLLVDVNEPRARNIIDDAFLKFELFIDKIRLLNRQKMFTP